MDAAVRLLPRAAVARGDVYKRQNQALFITSAAAVAAAEGIEKVTARETGIKWVNDVFCGGLKVCGILTEASIDLENGMFTHVIVGTGTVSYTHLNLAAAATSFSGDGVDEINFTLSILFLSFVFRLERVHKIQRQSCHSLYPFRLFCKAVKPFKSQFDKYIRGSLTIA